MFSRKKKNYTWIWVCSILAIAILAVLILIGSLSGRSSEEALRDNLKREAEKRQELSDSAKEDIYEEDAGRDLENDAEAAAGDQLAEEGVSEENTEENGGQNQFYQSYYFVKCDNNVIKIFFSDESGNLIELEETAIIYETLSPADQKRFSEGIKVESRDALNSLIMNYES